jgi:PAS domain S-box-containing protein
MRVAFCRTRKEGWPAPAGPPAGWDVSCFSSVAELVEALHERDFDAAVVALPDDPDRLTELLSRVRVAAPDVPILIAAPAAREPEAAEAAASGAADYWLDAMSPLRLRYALEQAAFRRRSAAVQHARDEVLDRIDDAVVVADAEKRIVSWNRAAERLYGRRAEEALGSLLPETLSPLWVEAESRLKAWRAVAARGLWLGETLIARDGGPPARVAVEIAVARDGRGRRAGLLVVARPAASAPARDPSVPVGDARQFLERILNAIADPVFVKDRRHRMLFVNDALCALTGIPRDKMLGRDESQYLSPDQAAVFHRQDDLVFESGRENVNEEVLTDARGMAHVLVTKKTVWRDADGRPYLVGVIREITDLVKAVDDLKRSQGQVRRAQKLEAVGRLAGGVAHDFNNVLTAIVGCANLVLDALPPGHPAREDVQEIRRAGERAGDLSRQLLSFSRRPEGLPQLLDLRELFGGMRKMLARLLPAHIELEFRVPDRLGAVRIDPGQAEQVLLNLVVNAGDAMPGGGRVVVELRDAPAGGGGLPGPCVSLSVSDNGVGMDEPTRAAIFEPFFTTKPQGTGFGLTTVRDVVSRSGGVVAVESAPDRGSCFRVFWPLSAGKAESAAGRRPARGRRAPRRACVLVVEDDDAVRRFVVRCLEQTGYEVYCAADGLEALRLSDAHEGAFDVAVVDVILPRLIGPEFVERMRARQPTAKILYISGQLTEPAVQTCSTSARGAFLPKPFDAPMLAERVRALLEPAPK